MPEQVGDSPLYMNCPTCLPAGVVSIGAAAPDNVLTNDDLEKMVDTNDEWITTRTGIKTRHIAPEGVTTSDLAVEASEIALERAGMTAKELDSIIIGTITPDWPFPATACVVQDRLGARTVPAFDLSAGCSGFLYALALGFNLVGNGTVGNSLVIGVELLSRVQDYTDRTTCVLFGDGAGAVVVKPVKKGSGVLSYALGADGGGAEYIYVPAGASKLPASHETVDARQHYVKMKGRDVFTTAVKRMTEMAETVLADAGYTIDDVDLLVPHQANHRIIKAVCRNLEFPMDKTYINLAEYGNTSAASIPLALAEAEQEGKLKNGDLVLMVSFGTGITWGGMLMRWGSDGAEGGSRPQPIRSTEPRGGK